MSKLADFEITNAKRLMAQLNRLSDKVERSIGRKATSYAMTPVSRAARSEAPVGQTGNLKRSIGKKSKAYRSGTAVTLVGPRIRGSHQGYHGHLVHDGHLAPDGSFVPGNPWIRRAADRLDDEVTRRMIDKLSELIEKEAARG